MADLGPHTEQVAAHHSGELDHSKPEIQDSSAHKLPSDKEANS